jgi:CrcB protein
VNFLYVGLGGVLGALARYSLAGGAYRFLKLGPPWGTLLVNITGCFGIGILFSFAEGRGWSGAFLRHFLMIGFLGAYTTFSTYILESFVLMDQGRFLVGLGNLLLSVLLGLLSFWAGMILGRLWP